MLLHDSHANLLDVLVGRRSARRALDTRQPSGTLFSLHAPGSRWSSWSFHSRKPSDSFRPPQTRLPGVTHRSLWARLSHISKVTPCSCFTFFTRGTLFTLGTRFTEYTPVSFHSRKSRGPRQARKARAANRSQFPWYAWRPFWSYRASTAWKAPGSPRSNLSWGPLLAWFP